MKRSNWPSTLILPLLLFVLCSASKCAWATPVSTTTTLSVTSSGSPVSTVPAKTVVTLTATVKAGSTLVKLGQVKLCDATAAYCTDIHLLATAQLTSAGTATYKFVPGPGSHSYKAVFAGTTSYATSSSAAAAVTVNALTGKHLTATTIASSGNPDNLTLTATVTGYLSQAGTVAPTGTVSFVDTTNANKILASADLGAGVASMSLRNSQALAANPSPLAVIQGDFNGDGFVDLAGITQDGNSVMVWLGNGDGTFRAAPSHATGNGSAGIATGDFNGDGLTDLAICNETDATVTVLLSNGDGTFTDAPSPSTDAYPASIAVADLNGDGIADLEVAGPTYDNGDPARVTILLGNGDGTFSSAGTISMSDMGDGAFITVGDFNGDGFPDLAVMVSVYNGNGTTGCVTILLNNGTGTFQAAQPQRMVDNPTALVAADLNGDRKADLIVAGPGVACIVYLGHGD